MVNGKEITEKFDICNQFNNYFSNVGTSLIKNLKSTPTSYTEYLHAPLKNSIFFDPVDQIELHNTISQLNLRKSSGSDDISSKLVSLCSSALTEPLTYIYNLSISSGIVPHELKIAKVIPIFKKVMYKCQVSTDQFHY